MAEAPTASTERQPLPGLARFVERTLAVTPGGLLTAPFDPEWRSPCERRQEAETTFWAPAPQETRLDFSGLANAAETDIHPDICHYYSSYWSGSLQGRTREGPVSLIQLWNPEDFERLQENLVGHLFYKIRAKQTFTVFFANTDPDSELFLSIDNVTGQVLLEEPGKSPLRVVDESIEAFLNRLEPDLQPPGIY